MNGIVGKHATVKRRRNRNKPAWLSREIFKAIRKKKRPWKQVKNSRITDKYKSMEKEVNNMMRNAKKRCEKKLAECNDGNKIPFLSYIKLQIQSRPTMGPLKDDGGENTVS
jgi:hypothetical protein